MLILEIAAGVALAPVLWIVGAVIIGAIRDALERSSYTSL